MTSLRTAVCEQVDAAVVDLVDVVVDDWDSVDVERMGIG